MASGHSKLAFFTRALKYRNYRLFFCGQAVSLIGTWMSTTATSWLAFRLTGSPMFLGLVGFAGQLPAFALSPVAGIFVDRWDKRKLLIATQVGAMLQSLALAFLTLTHQITLPWLLGLSAFQGLLNAFDMPARQSYVVDMIEKKEDLPNAIALNSSMFNVARLVGPAIGGVIIAAIGEGWCFMLDGVTYLAVIGSLVMMTTRSRRQVGPFSARLAVAQLREGWRYVAHSKPLRSIIGLLALVSLAGVPYSVLMPIFAGQILEGGPHTLGFLMTAAGGGALGAALWLAARKSVLGLGGLIPKATAVFGFGLIAFSFSRSIPLSAALLVVTGCAFMLEVAASNTILQTIVDDDKRGRVMSLFIMAFLGTAPFGSLFAGSLSQRIGAPLTLTICGICCIIAAGWFYRQLPEIRDAVRPIYVSLGILPEVAVGLQTAARLSNTPED